jgi:hypothetical protein
MYGTIINVSVLLNSGSSPDGNFNAIQIVENATIKRILCI